MELRNTSVGRVPSCSDSRSGATTLGKGPGASTNNLIDVIRTVHKAREVNRKKLTSPSL